MKAKRGKALDLPRMELLGGVVGPLKTSGQVPLWLACYLEERDLVEVERPEWLDEANLERML